MRVNPGRAFRITSRKAHIWEAQALGRIRFPSGSPTTPAARIRMAGAARRKAAIAWTPRESGTEAMRGRDHSSLNAVSFKKRRARA
jgi:hypothetical protein